MNCLVYRCWVYTIEDSSDFTSAMISGCILSNMLMHFSVAFFLQHHRLQTIENTQFPYSFAHNKHKRYIQQNSCRQLIRLEPVTLAWAAVQPSTEFSHLILPCISINNINPAFFNILSTSLYQLSYCAALLILGAVQQAYLKCYRCCVHQFICIIPLTWFYPDDL